MRVLSDRTGLLTLCVLVAAGCFQGAEQASTACLPDYEEWVGVVQERTTPATTPADVYKLVHQGLAGPGHAAPSREAASRWLAEEIERLRESDGQIVPLVGEQALVPIRPDSSIVRVNLRPWLASARSTDVLLEAFLQTADAIRPSPSQLAADFEGVTACLLGAAADGALGLDRDELQKTFDEARRTGYPAGRHSEQYQRVRRPAYRVVERSRLTQVGRDVPTDERAPAE